MARVAAVSRQWYRTIISEDHGEYSIHLAQLQERAALRSFRFEITQDDERAFQGHLYVEVCDSTD